MTGTATLSILPQLCGMRFETKNAAAPQSTEAISGARMQALTRISCESCLRSITEPATAISIYPAAVEIAAPAILSCGMDMSSGFSKAFSPTEQAISTSGMYAFPIA